MYSRDQIVTYEPAPPSAGFSIYSPQQQRERSSMKQEIPNIETPWSTVGYITAKRTYTRRIEAGNPESPTEEWRDVVERVVTACDTQLGVGFTPEEETRLAGYMLALKGTVAGRFLWQLGTPTVERLGLLSLQNCSATVI